ncbi:MAG: flavoprotein [Verrucomicrobiota bacterium]
MKEKCIVLGVTGSIAAYKTADIASALTQKGVAVYTVMTLEAQKFITPLTFGALTHRPVVTTLWEDGTNFSPIHISLAERADLVLIAPATAHILAQMAHGLASDALSTLLLAVTCPIIVAPAMNGKMWRHPATQENVKILKKRGVEFFGPEKGMLSCDCKDEGRLCASTKIVDAISKKLNLR